MEQLWKSEIVEFQSSVAVRQRNFLTAKELVMSDQIVLRTKICSTYHQCMVINTCDLPNDVKLTKIPPISGFQQVSFMGFLSPSCMRLIDNRKAQGSEKEKLARKEYLYDKGKKNKTETKKKRTINPGSFRGGPKFS